MAALKDHAIVTEVGCSQCESHRQRSTGDASKNNCKGKKTTYEIIKWVLLLLLISNILLPHLCLNSLLVLFPRAIQSVERIGWQSAYLWLRRWRNMLLLLLLLLTFSQICFNLLQALTFATHY